jgi:mannose-6-phosphate isomerase-like protein (cupin superfamily)
MTLFKATASTTKRPDRSGRGCRATRTLTTSPYPSRRDEIFWIIEGHLTYRCGGETFPAAPGSYVRIPAECPTRSSSKATQMPGSSFCTRPGVQSSFSSNWVVPPKAMACHHKDRWISSCWHGLAPSSIRRSWRRH